jgi:hypothetical protein
MHRSSAAAWVRPLRLPIPSLLALPLRCALSAAPDKNSLAVAFASQNLFGITVSAQLHFLANLLRYLVIG